MRGGNKKRREEEEEEEKEGWRRRRRRECEDKMRKLSVWFYTQSIVFGSRLHGLEELSSNNS